MIQEQDVLNEQAKEMVETMKKAPSMKHGEMRPAVCWALKKSTIKMLTPANKEILSERISQYDEKGPTRIKECIKLCSAW